MEEKFVGRVSDLAGGNRLIVTLEDQEVSVFEVNGSYVAFENRCLHQGGPVGEGSLMNKVEAVVGPNREVLGERFNDEVLHLVCPWHGWEYDVATGECAADRSLKLNSYEVRVREGNVYVLV